MKGNKIIATLVVLVMVLSTLVALNVNFVEKASAKAPVAATTPGVNKYGNATTDLKYGMSYSSVAINSSKWTGVGPFYLYYPTYRSGGAGGNANTFTWDGPYQVSAYNVRVTSIANSATLDTGGSAITFNRSGMWIFDNNGVHAGNDNTSYAGYIWVNTSTNYSIESVTDFKFGDAGSKTITVNTGSDTGCMIAIMDPNNKTVYHKWRATGVTETIKIEAANFSMAGDYTVKAYRDFDAQNSTYYYPDEYYTAGGITENYSNYYGRNFTGYFPTHTLYASEFYNYTYMGPWDPPEKNATEITFTVTTGKPNIVLTNTTIYWGFETRIDVNVTDNDGNGLDANKESIKLRHGNTYYDYTDVWINNTGNGNYSIEIPRMSANWTNIGPLANGTWKVYFANDTNKDGTDEWNNSVSFTVKSANPPVQLVIVNDGSGKATDKKVDIPAYASGDNQAPTITIAFDIFGTSISDDQGRAYYGDDDPPEDYKNITISGDILYPVDAAYIGPNGRWEAYVTPTKPGGTITIAIDWPGDDNGTASQTIEIVNGTQVTPAVEKFTVGQHYNLTVTVKDMYDDPVKNAQVWLIWEDGNGQFNSTNGTSKPGNGLNGEYTFWINPDDDKYPTTAPQNLTIAAKWITGTTGFWGYTEVVMARNHNMRVNATPTTAYAGDSTIYDISISLIDGGNPSKTDLTIAIYNSTGALVTGDDAWYKDGSYSITEEEIILSGGTFYLFAHNDTHDSEGNNATLLITNYNVTSSPSILAWMIDTAVNMTFQLIPAGNGTLTLNNMSSVPEASDLGQSTQISIVNGVGTLDEVDATTLGNVTFEFTPDGGAARSADGLLRVTTATATPSPATIYNGEPTSVTITVTHPATGALLEDVRVGLDHGFALNASILAKLPSDQFTGADGKVQFSITADASGNVTIYIENETDPDNAFVIMAKARMQMTISNDPSVDEGKTFTVEAKSYGVLITAATVTFTFNGQTWPTTTGIATLTAPSVTTSLTYPITATADGYTSASGTIMVLNVPKLTIIPPSGKVSGTQKFVVTIANDAGAGVTGAKVTFDGVDYYSGVNGACELTAPDVKEEFQNFQITATFTGYTDAAAVTIKILKTPGIPGFELLTLVAAIGVAFLFLRRRRN